jgi:putative CGCGG family rSAM target protein
MFGSELSPPETGRSSMAAPSHDDVESPATRDHDTSWSANLEKPRHAEDRDRVVTEALEAVANTATGTHVNLVTHADHGHPDGYLTDVLESEVDRETEWEYVDQCGCGGHVLRVHVR